jgi:glucokinase
VAEWKNRTGEEIAGGKEIAQAAINGDQFAIAIYSDFGTNLAEFIAPWLNSFNADAFVIGGNIARDWDLYVPALQAGLADKLKKPAAIKPCTLGEQAPIYGAALALRMINATVVSSKSM